MIMQLLFAAFVPLSMASAQRNHVTVQPAPEQLLQDTAKNYQKLTGYELHANVLIQIPDSSWQVNTQVIVEGPRREVEQDGTTKMKPEAMTNFGFKPVNTLAGSQQPLPNVSVSFSHGMVYFDKMADAANRVERIGSEVLKLNGDNVTCEILKVMYEQSNPESVTYWIYPARHLALKVVLKADAGPQAKNALWTITFDSAKFDQPAPQWLLNMANLPAVTVRKEWIGKAAPAFSLPGVDGKPVTLSSLQGKVVLLDFWSITCGPCKLEMPMLEEVGQEFERKGVALVGISFDPADKSKTWLERNHRSLDTLTDFDFVVSDAYKVQGIPALVLIGRDGKIEQYWEGPVQKATIEEAIASTDK